MYPPQASSDGPPVGADGPRGLGPGKAIRSTTVSCVRRDGRVVLGASTTVVEREEADS